MVSPRNPRWRGALLSALLLLSAPAFPSGTAGSGGVDATLERIEALARDFGRAQQHATEADGSAATLAAIHDRMVAEVERLRLAAAASDHRTARHILERFHDAAFSFARNYLGPGEAVIEGGDDREVERELRRYREAVSRMKGNLFGWNPDLDQLLADLGEATRLIGRRLASAAATPDSPLAGL